MNANRDIFGELMEGFTALADERDGKRTLRHHVVSARTISVVTPQEIVELRKHLSVSRPVMADYLRVKERTLESWEQGRSRPNEQACALIRMVEKFPDTLERLAAIS